jgi:thiol-disulfide isomerase/thioredoxin
MRALTLLVILVLPALLSGMVYRSNGNSEPIKTISEGSTSLKIYDFDGLEHYFNKQNDTTYAINFWSTWCKPCVKELPHFESFAKSMEGKKFKLLLVSLDFPSVYEKSLIQYLKTKGIESECVVLDDSDANAWIPKVDSSWTGAIPATVIYKRGDRVFHEGYMPQKQLHSTVEQIMLKQ